MQTLQKYLISCGFPQAVSLPIDGQTHRFDRAGTLSGWFNGYPVQVATSGHTEFTVILAEFGDWKSGEKLSYQSEVPPELENAFHIALAAVQAKRSEEKRKLQEAMATECEQEWESAIQLGTTAYLRDKGIKSLFGARITQDGQAVLVPLRDEQGRLWSLQRIYSKSSGLTVTKQLKADARMKGCFFHIGDLTTAKEIYVCEGYATGVSIYEALGTGGQGYAVVCALSAGNISAVGAPLSSRYPGARLFWCADNDQFTRRPTGEPWNPGADAALAAASQVGGEVRVPQFKDLSRKPTDFNDLALQEGLAVVREQLLNSVAAPGIGSAPPAPPAKKKKSPPNEKAIADRLLQEYEGRLARQDKVVFLYDGAKWSEIDSTGVDRLKNQLNRLCGDSLGSREIDSLYRTFFRYIPGVPQGANFFEPPCDRVNFRNGTLHLDFQPKTPEEVQAAPGSGTHRFNLRFAPHRAADYCTTVLPLDYRPHPELPENTQYEEMLKRIWPDSHYSEKRAYYEELLGSCLVPLFPKITFFLGRPGTGKSTLIMLAAKLVGPENVAGCDPTTWGNSFGLQPMLNKLVNFDTDINTTKRIADDMVKKVTDRRVSIARKNTTNAEAKLPAIHIFGANEMPRSAEGLANVYDRRVVILYTDAVQPGKGGGGEFADWVWSQGPEGILKAALRGLERLLSQGGNHTIPESSQQEVREWGVENDQVERFVAALERGEISCGASGTPGKKLRLIVREGASISSALLYECFVTAVIEFDAMGNNRGYILTKDAFAKRLRRDLRFGSRRTKADRMTVGIGVAED